MGESDGVGVGLPHGVEGDILGDFLSEDVTGSISRLCGLLVAAPAQEGIARAGQNRRIQLHGLTIGLLTTNGRVNGDAIAVIADGIGLGRQLGVYDHVTIYSGRCQDLVAFPASESLGVPAFEVIAGDIRRLGHVGDLTALGNHLGGVLVLLTT